MYKITFFLVLLSLSLYGAEGIEELENEIDNLNVRLDELKTSLLEINSHHSIITYDDGEVPVKTVYDDGFELLGNKELLKIGGWAQVDYRFFLAGRPGVNQFVIRRARLDFRGTLEEIFAYRLQAEFGNASHASLLYLWFEYKKFPWARIRVGQYKQPFCLETLYSSRWLRFLERGLGPTNIATSEDIGIMLFGKVFSDKLVYAFGIFNGLGKNHFDNNESKEFAGRVVFQPYAGNECHLLEKFYFGGSLTSGYNNTDVGGHSFVTGLKTKFINFDDDAFQKGNRFRIAFESEWIYGSFDISGEYLHSCRKGVGDENNRETLKNDSWYVSALYLLTGEQQVRNYYVTPLKNFDPCKRGAWGAFEIGVRYEKFLTNDKPFKKSVISGAQDVWALTFGVNWWPNIYVKFMSNFIYTDFGETIVANNKKVSDEKGFAFRAQYNY